LAIRKQSRRATLHLSPETLPFHFCHAKEELERLKQLGEKSEEAVLIIDAEGNAKALRRFFRKELLRCLISHLYM
jgi:hypothetical protein